MSNCYSSHCLIECHFPSSTFTFPYSVLLSVHLILSWRLWGSLSAISHSWCCFSHCSLCSSPFPTFRPGPALTGSGAGRDDSRARFSLWVYYLCSGPFKTTQNGPGSQCGEFALTSCLFLLFFSPLPRLALFLPPVSVPLGKSVEDCGPRQDCLFPALSPVSFWI